MDLKVPEQLKEFEPLFTTQCVDPKKGTFLFDVNDPTDDSDSDVTFIWNQKDVEVRWLFGHNECSEPRYGEEYSMTHENCLAYLAQLPKPWHVFTNEIIKHNKERAGK